jgi:diadenosine tetraphosphatase ApaH/serine/threonine PP2A family protein phosphatase
MNRRSFLKQSFAFSALAAGAGRLSGLTTDPDVEAHHLLMLGDWGADRNLEGQTKTARQMVEYSDRLDIDTEALFFLGDSWYGAMPGGVKDPRWKTQFEEMYPKEEFDCPVYSIMGNHDYQRDPSQIAKTEMELDYAKGKGTRWTQPGLYYSFYFPQEDPLMRVIALDSNAHAGHPETLGFFTMSEEHWQAQLKWLEAELAKPKTTPFLAVMGHHPVFSNGPHGDNKRLIADWEPLLRKYGVDFYFAGHDHDLQHLEFEGHPTSFVCSGAGGADLYDLKIGEEKRGPFAEKVFGFTHVEVAQDWVKVRHIAADGRVVHGFSKGRDGLVRIDS